MSLLAWPDGWRLSGRAPRHHVNPPPPREFPCVPALVAQDFDAIYGGAYAGRRSCSDGHDLVIWHGDDPCFVCGGEAS